MLPLTDSATQASTVVWIALGCGLLSLGSCRESGSESDYQIVGIWHCALQTPGGELPFRMDLVPSSEGLSARLVNASEIIPISTVQFTGNHLVVDMPHYDSQISAQFDPAAETMTGMWEKRRSKDEIARVQFSARRPQTPDLEDADRWLGRWRVDFHDSDEPAVATINRMPYSKNLSATFLTTTGDYRYLFGGVTGQELTLSCFDGAHAFLFKATMVDGKIRGDFWSGDWSHESWTAQRDEMAALPDAFAQTHWTDQESLGELSFPDVDGNPVALGDPRFRGKPRIIEVFGSWCPNCHDAAMYLAELQERYGPRGLVIIGLAFELTGDFQRDAEQVRRYIERHDVQYPVLVAGLADKQKATESFPVLDRVRAYPTLIFVGADNQVRGIYTGFSGPATGEAHKTLRQQIESIIEQMLDPSQS